MAGQGRRLEDATRHAILLDLQRGMSFSATARRQGVSAMTVSRLAAAWGIRPPRNIPKNTRAGRIAAHRARQEWYVATLFTLAEEQLDRDDLTADDLLRTMLVFAHAVDLARALEGLPPASAPEDTRFYRPRRGYRPTLGRGGRIVMRREGRRYG